MARHSSKEETPLWGIRLLNVMLGSRLLKASWHVGHPARFAVLFGRPLGAVFDLRVPLDSNGRWNPTRFSNEFRFPHVPLIGDGILLQILSIAIVMGAPPVFG